MKIDFSKYHGAGNDFIMIDGVQDKRILPHLTQKIVRRMCDRRFGIGADGLIVMQEHDELDFEMIYFNADGAISSMCGNGGRCLIDFAASRGRIQDEARFMAYDGPHQGNHGAVVSLSMSDVDVIERISDSIFYLDTGSPHYVSFVDDDTHLDHMDIVTEARRIRYNERFRDKGTNVNFVSQSAEGISLRTYERGVEDETLACGTGVVAAAISAFILNSKEEGDHSIRVKAKGGELSVTCKLADEGFTEIWLYGPAEKVYDGVVEI